MTGVDTEGDLTPVEMLREQALWSWAEHFEVVEAAGFLARPVTAPSSVTPGRAVTAPRRTAAKRLYSCMMNSKDICVYTSTTGYRWEGASLKNSLGSWPVLAY